LWQDSGLIQYRVWHNDIEGFLGLALSHPLYYLVAMGAKYIPLGQFGQRVNLLSALAGAVAVANVYLLVRLWLGKDFPALIAAATLALSHTFWRHASIAETYTLWTALFVGELIVLLQYARTRRIGYLYALGLLNGLALAVHMLASIALVCYAVFVGTLTVKKRVGGRNALVVLLFWIVGASPFLLLIVNDVIQSGDVLATLASAAFGDRWRGDVLNVSVSGRIVWENIAFILLNFATPNLLLFPAGCYALYKLGPTSAFRNVVLALLVLFFAFAFRYTVSDRYAFFIPFYCVVSIVIGLGAHTVLSKLGRRALMYAVAAFCAFPVGAYAAAPGLAERWNLTLGTRQDVPYRNDYEYFLIPWKTGYRGAERFAAEALASVESDAVIYADTTTVGPLLYAQQVRNTRPDVSIIAGIVGSERAPLYGPEVCEQLVKTRPIYVTSVRAGYGPAFVLERYDLARVGVLWRVVKRSPGEDV
jgi:hypothetical protein